MAQRASVPASVHEGPAPGTSPTNDHTHHADLAGAPTSDDSEDVFRAEIPADEIPGLREAITRQVEEQLRSGKLPGLKAMSLAKVRYCCPSKVLADRFADGGIQLACPACVHVIMKL
ncbi:uncharacterized protein RCC_06048 [Ramularia collo-cygni]|uniref:Uncharacterized protein n=1 Tax=Ramularia collo-cygni TaxID=112498 RepID=A0A2D3UUE0_9PEZI|nr:uncharacterized protein RCC_06048 [Ramularia collo-cygni]CZT20191.1 uncharacterized protein RCC_06048 [Ramularia collo-cygni]